MMPAKVEVQDAEPEVHVPEAHAPEPEVQVAHPTVTLTPAEREATLTLLRNLLLKGYRLHLQADSGDGPSIGIDTDREVSDDLVDRLRDRKPQILAVLQGQQRAAERMAAMEEVGRERRTVCMETLWGIVWVVPECTGAPRVEITWAEIHADPMSALERCSQLAAAVDLLGGRLLVGDLS